MIFIVWARDTRSGILGFLDIKVSELWSFQSVDAEPNISQILANLALIFLPFY